MSTSRSLPTAQPFALDEELNAKDRADLFRDRKLWERIASTDAAGAAVPSGTRISANWLEWLELLNAGDADADRLREVARRGAPSGASTTWWMLPVAWRH